MMAQSVPGDFELVIRQQPKNGCVALTKGKDRRPLDPPPIVQLRISSRSDPSQRFLQNPYLILVAKLLPKGSDDPEERRSEPKSGDLAGTVVSSLYNLKDLNNQQGGFFVFGDLSVKKEGTFRLEFILFELKPLDRECWQLASKISEEFTVYASKSFPGLAESTFLTRSFSDQGVRLRLRKDSRTVISRKRGAGSAQVDHMKGPSMGYMGPHDGAHDLSPNGQASHLARRQSALDGSYDNTYDFYDGRASKRMRQHSNGEHSPYDTYAYPNPSPRTMPEPLGSYPMSTSYHMPTQPAVSALPMPGSMNSYAPLHRLDTQIPPHIGGPNSASPTFSPEVKRSPGAAYPYPPQTHLYTASPTALTYQQAPSAPSYQQSPSAPSSMGHSQMAGLPNLSNLHDPDHFSHKG
ncbi:velvet factor-domain-containing protein [Cladorrhinum samala]|uniref:Velvet factor-domain-containing protein n=1 Tax=Cladorrhinum samala TaxID=585594 RepID=A0AAV9HHB0_9PEZI|nr:velvet factor-domain-containing protein [Cladorrhinum samala]